MMPEELEKLRRFKEEKAVEMKNEFKNLLKKYEEFGLTITMTLPTLTVAELVKEINEPDKGNTDNKGR